MFGNAPRTSEISVADAVHRSVVTRNYLKKYFGQLQRVAGAGARTEAYEERSRSGYGRLRLSSVSPPFCLGAGNTAALFSLIELAPQEAGPFVCDLRCPCVHGLIEEP